MIGWLHGPKAVRRSDNEICREGIAHNISIPHAIHSDPVANVRITASQIARVQERAIAALRWIEFRDEGVERTMQRRLKSILRRQVGRARSAGDINFIAR